MAMNCWLLDRLGIANVGLCHSVQGTSRMLARQIDVPYEEVTFLAAGINHQSWFLRFRRGNEDLYPRLRDTMIGRHIADAAARGLVQDTGDHSEADRGDSDYEGGSERVRTEVMAAFGYFHTESSHHASEYLPYFRKDAATTDGFIANRWDYYQICAAHDAGGQTERLLERLKLELEPSLEYGARIVRAMETGEPAVVYGNVPNRGLIANLPEGCCVEAPCLVDGNGVQGTAIEALPPQLAAVNRTNVNVQELAVAAVMEENADHVRHAIALDPLTGALLTLEQIRAMTDELLGAERAWLPGFVGEQRPSPPALWATPSPIIGRGGSETCGSLM